MGFGAETITRWQNKIVQYFRDNGACSVTSALPENEVLQVSSVNKRTLRILIREGVIVKCSKGLYLDVDRWDVFKHSIKRFFLIW